MEYAFTAQQLADLKSLLNTMATPYQRRWYAEGLEHRRRSYTKHRQAGADMFFALEGLIDAMETGRNQHYFAPLLKYSLAWSRKYICHFAAKVGIKIAQFGREIAFSNGARIVFHGGLGLSLAALHGNVYLSEYAWANHPYALFQSALAVSCHSRYRLTLFTSVSPNPEAFAVWKRSQAKGFSQVHTIEDTAAQGGLWDVLDVETLKRECTLEEFRQLYLCEWPQEVAQ
ncbi:terminase large subunit domain-containing protein [Serratia marcescens]|uniref:terminase large subunit domain-containing protein n=1 Tax=Serratia marcescens TaxID=615 RepID=UPI002360A06C|nr:terminase family protein [Serratia marcescens]